MANAKFKPKASSNTIEGATPVVDTEVTNTPDMENTETVVTVEESPKEETAKAESTVTFEDTESKKPVEKNVKVCLKANHSCFIGGVAYHFEKGKQVNVPSSVKAILLQADLLMPL